MKKLLYDNRLRYRGSRHLLFFSVTVFVFSLILFSQHAEYGYWPLLRITFFNALLFFAYAYITIFVLIPEFLIKRKVAFFFLLFLLTGFGLSALKLTFSDTIFYAFISPENVPEAGVYNLKSMVVNTKDMSFIIAVFCIAKYVKDFIYAEQIRTGLEKQKKAAQKKLLGSQFDPHFLFNTINNLYALSLLNPEKTREVIYRIKIILGYIISESQKEFVKLSEEISLVENYIQLEKLRYGKRLRVTFNKDTAAGNTSIPPMILFFFVENCFKHGSSLDAGVPWINVYVSVDGDNLTLTTENSKPHTSVQSHKEEKEGEGYRNLIKRLNILYGTNGYNLTIENCKTTFKAGLELQTNINIEVLQSTYR